MDAARTNPVSRAIAGVSLFSANKPKGIVAVILVLTLLLGAGTFRLTFSNDFLEALPNDEPNAMAARATADGFETFFNSIQVVFAVDEAKWEKVAGQLPNRVTQADKGNISDEVYVRGMDEFYRFMAAEMTTVKEFFDLSYPYGVRAINWSNTAVPGIVEPDPSAFSMPGTDPAGEVQYLMAWQTVMTTNPDDIAIVTAPDWKAAQGTYPMVPKDGITEDELGRDIQRSLDAYKEWVVKEGQWDVFRLDEMGMVLANPVITAHSNDLTKEDLLFLAPLVVGFIVVTLYFAFRDMRAIFLSTSIIVLAVVWTMGLMGWLGIAINALNLTILPLIMGVGIDYSIHMVNEYLEHKSHGSDDKDALRKAGDRAGFALFIATATTVAGLLVMVFSPSTLMAELGVVSAASIAIVFGLSITFIPALLSLFYTDDMGHSYRPMPSLARLGAVLSRNRVLVATGVIVVSAALLWNASGISYEVFGNPVKNFPEDDPLRQSFEVAATNAFGEGRADYVSNFFIVQGDLTQPAAHDYIRDLMAAIKSNDKVRPEGTQSIVGVIETYVSVKDGTAAAPLIIGLETAQPGSTYPATQADIRTALDDMYTTDAFAPYATMFINADYDIAVVSVDMQEGETFEDTQATWASIWKSVDDIGDPPAGMQVNLYGYTAFNYLFVTYEMPWVAYMGIAAFLIVAVLVGVFTRSLRATLAVATLALTTSIWWLGILPLFDIGLAITLMLPMAFIMCIGSDYAVHLAWNIHKVGDAAEVFANVGKAVVVSAITTLGAFVLFVPMRDLMMRRTMIATTLAIVMILVTTYLTVPLFYRVPQPATAAQRAEEAVPGGTSSLD